MMSGLDRLLAKSLSNVLRENLGARTTKKIEEKLYTKYGLTLQDAMEQFSKLDSILKEFFGKNTAELEKKLVETICKVKTKTKNNNWFLISNFAICNKILAAFGDKHQIQIINTVSDRPKTIQDILQDCKIPQTSGYRKINSLIQSGLLTVDGHVNSNDGRKINKYGALLNNVQINIDKKEITVNVQLNQKHLKNSSIFQVIYDK